MIWSCVLTFKLRPSSVCTVNSMPHRASDRLTRLLKIRSSPSRLQSQGTRRVCAPARRQTGRQAKTQHHQLCGSQSGTGTQLTTHSYTTARRTSIAASGKEQPKLFHTLCAALLRLLRRGLLFPKNESCKHSPVPDGRHVTLLWMTLT